MVEGMEVITNVMKTSELIYCLRLLMEKHGDKEVFVDGYGVLSVDYNVADDCIDIDS